MNEFAAKKDNALPTHFDIVRRIETMSGEVPYAIKQFKSQVADFCAMDRKLSAMKSKTERKASAKALDRLDELVNGYKAAYRKCLQNYNSIIRALDEIDALYTKLASQYHADGKRREARRATADGEKFDKLSRKQLAVVYDKLEANKEIAIAKEGASPKAEDATPEKAGGENRFDAREADARQRRDDASRRFAETPGAAPHKMPPYPHHAPSFYSPYGMPPAYYQPMPSFNIAPISIDVNSAVDSVFESFAKAFDERVREYAENIKLPEIKANGANLADSAALNKVLEDEGFIMEKLSGLFERFDSMLATISTLTEKCSELEEKNRFLLEAIKGATDTERNLARELQGIQATQKVIGVDQLKLAEEQAIIVESQSLAIARQKELSDLEAAVSAEMKALLDGANASLEGFKASAEAQGEITNSLGEIISANDKLLELQKNLEERQSELTEMQRDALLAHKKLARSQKAVNERSGAKTKPRAEKAELDAKELEGELKEDTEVIAEVQAEEVLATVAPVILEETVEAKEDAKEDASSEPAAEVSVEASESLAAEESREESSNDEELVAEAIPEAESEESALEEASEAVAEEAESSDNNEETEEAGETSATV